MIEIFKKINQYKLEKKDLLKLDLIIKNSEFQHFKEVKDDISSYLSSQDVESVHESCKTILTKNQNVADKLLKLFYLRLSDYCLKNFYAQLASSQSLNKTEMNLNLFQLTPVEFRHYLTQHLENIDSSSMEFTEFGEKYRDLIKNDDNFYDEKIISLLNPSQDLSHIIQSYNLKSKQHHSLFHLELKSILDHIIVAYDQGDFPDALKNFEYAVSFYSENIENINTKKAWPLFTGTAKSLLTRGEIDLSKKIFDFSSTLSVEELKNEAIFNQYWTYILKGDYKSPISLAKKNKIYNEINKLDQKLIFWIGYCHLKLGETDQAKKYLEFLTLNYPLSFYTAVVFNYNMIDKLHSISPDRNLASINEISFSQRAERIKAWSQLGSDKFINAEMESVALDLQKSPTLDSSRNKNIETLAEILFKNKKHNLNFKILHQSLDEKFIISQKILRFLFPLEHVAEIKKESKGLPITLAMSLIRQESAFNQNAISIAGARGVMQLMPNTAKRFSRNVRISDLFVPKTNIKIGILYLKDLFKRYDGSLVHVLAAYNAGEGNVAKWNKKILTFDDPLINIESIPFRETRQYVKLIYRNMFFYSILLEEKALNGFKITP